MRVGLLLEGGIDEELIPPLLRQLIPERQGGGPDYFLSPYPPNGFGAIPKNLRVLIELYRHAEERRRLGCDLFVIILDARKTDAVQREIKEILRKEPDFPAVFGVAIQETEAWVLGDIDNANRRLFKIDPPPRLPDPPERDADPKKTLTDLFIRPSPALEYDTWNAECARAVAPHLRQAQVAFRCPKGFGRLADKFKNYAGKARSRRKARP